MSLLCSAQPGSCLCLPLVCTAVALLGLRPSERCVCWSCFIGVQMLLGLQLLLAEPLLQQLLSTHQGLAGLTAEVSSLVANCRRQLDSAPEAATAGEGAAGTAAYGAAAAAANEAATAADGAAATAIHDAAAAAAVDAAATAAVDAAVATAVDAAAAAADDAAATAADNAAATAADDAASRAVNDATAVVAVDAAATAATDAAATAATDAALQGQTMPMNLQPPVLLPQQQQQQQLVFSRRVTLVLVLVPAHAHPLQTCSRPFQTVWVLWCCGQWPCRCMDPTHSQQMLRWRLSCSCGGTQTHCRPCGAA